MKFGNPVDNRFGVPVRTSKCGRASIAKVNRPGQQALFVATLDGVVLPAYWLLRETKEAVAAADRGDPLPAATRPAVLGQAEYVNVGADRGAESYERMKAWFRARTAAPSDSPFDVLGLPEDASDDVVRHRVRELQLAHHPDRNPGDEEAAAAFRRVQEAWARIQAAV
jgi:hypothetical protein